MSTIIKRFGICALVMAAVPAYAQSSPSFQLQKGQAIRIAPDGKVDVLATMQGDAAHIEKMERRAKPVRKGVVVWVGPDGKLRYLTDPLQGAEQFHHNK